jgi:hypothetical protein
MKRIILLLLIIFLFVFSPLFAQEGRSGRNIMAGFYTGGGINMPVRLTTKYITEETSPWHVGDSWFTGIKVSGMVSDHYRLEVAACYSGHRTSFELSPPIYKEKKVYSETFEMLSIPVALKRYLQNDYFLSAGTIIDFSLNSKPEWLDLQTGFGLTLGAGREFRTRWITFDLSPGLELHSVIPFTEDAYHQRLLVAGLRIGFSYNLTSDAALQDQVNEE